MLFADINDWQNENTDLVIRVFNWNLKHNVNRAGLWQRYLELSKAYHVSKKRAYDYIASTDDGVE